MASPAKQAKGLKSVPFRPINEFLTGVDRYGMPAINNLPKFNNRIISNLLYFQTNYMLLCVVCIFLFALWGFKKLLVGAIVVIPGLSLLVRDKIPFLQKLHRSNPNLTLISLLTEVVLLYFAMDRVVYYLFSLALPIGLCIGHAALRLRNTKNKANNVLDQVAGIYDNSPMYLFLKSCGLDASSMREE